MKSTEIRKRFFKYFGDHGHQHVSSSSLIPAQDPTLLFTNAGMNQFKDVFLGNEKRSYTRAVTIQKCVRAGGKHNDLDNVGFTKRHLTFFEMMGNFSFADYFKKEAIQFAWDFLTKEMSLPTHNLHATVYTTDDEAYDIWHKHIGIPQERMHRLGEKENFWQMGDIGPCGPCTEIHIDRGAAFGCADNTGCNPACDCDRFLEIWNLVFMQYNRTPDGTLEPLAQKGVDTGMGLERLCIVAQGKDSVYDTDLFASIISRIEQLTNLSYASQPADIKGAFNVLADHIRSTSFLIADGCAPSNEGRGYVLRKIIRRAALFAQKLTDKNIFPELSRALTQDMCDIYPELSVNQELIVKVLDSEIQKFAANLIRGKEILEQYFKESSNTKIITGQQAFKLYDTYGFPTELIIIMARERDYTVDLVGFDQEMQKQQEQSGKKTADILDHIKLDESIKTEFTGYQELETTSTIIALVHEDKSVKSVEAEQVCWLMTRKSPYFIVGGGQVPDAGTIIIDDHSTPVLALRFISGRIAVQIKTPVDLHIGSQITSIVDRTWRTNAMKNHTATHLLQSALIALFGKTIKQSGSLVHPDYLRFDFTYHEQLTSNDIDRIENLVNEKIREDIPVSIEYMPLKKALEQGALAFFGDKYNPEDVRMVNVPGFSVELCGGTHVPSTGHIGIFKIVEVSAPSAGQRRIVAVTGPEALTLFQETFKTVKTLSQEFKVKKDELVDAMLKQKDIVRHLNNSLKQLKQETWKAQVPTWLSNMITIQDTPFLFIKLENTPLDELRELASILTHKKSGLYALLSTNHERDNVMIALSQDLTSTINLKEMGSWLQQHVSLKGGGSSVLFQATGNNLTQSLENAIKEWIISQK